MKNNTEDIFFKVVPTKFPVIELGKAHGVRSCYIQKACMAPDYSNRNTPLVRKSAKFVICFAGPRSDVERSTGPEYITDTLRTYFPMDVISEHCDPLIISQPKETQQQDARQLLLTSVSVDDMKVLLRNSLLKYPKTATLLQPHEIQQLLKQSASNAAEIAMTTYWGYITTATETQPRELLEQEITRLQDELRRLKEK